MRSYIRQLYALVFECFADIFTEWQCSSWTRIKGSFNRNALNKIVDDHRSEMIKITDWLQREAELESSQEISDISRSTTGLPDELARLRNEMSSFKQGMLHLFLIGNTTPQQQKLFTTGNHMQQTLEEDFAQIAAEWIPVNSEARTKPAGMLEIEEIEYDSTSSSQSVNQMYARQCLQHAIGNLGLSLSRTSPAMPLISAADLSISPDVFDALRKWTISAASSFLWIEGPADVETPSQNTVTSVSLVGVAQRSNASYLAYFGQPPEARNVTGRAKRCSEDLVEMIYTLISQLVNQLPEEFESDADLSDVRFTCLNGTENSITPATLLLQDLLNALPSPLLCIIDGLQYLTYGKKDTIASIRNLVEVLCAPNHFQDRARKVCFTTDGYLGVLGDATKKVMLSRVTYESEWVDEDRRLQDL